MTDKITNENEPNIWYSSLWKSFSHGMRLVWDFLTRPHPSIQGVTEHRQARLAASVTLLLSIVNLIGIFATPASANDPTKMQTYYELGALGLAVFIAYIFSRTRYFMVGIVILMTSLSVISYSGAFVGDPGALAFALTIFPLTFILGFGLLSTRGVLMLTLTNITIPLLLPVLMPGKIGWGFTGAMVGQALTYGVLVLGVMINRNAIERDRLSEIRRVNDKLQELSTDLEQRVLERTRDIGLAAEIGKGISTVRNLGELLEESVELIRSRFDLYYTQLYLLDPAGRALILRAGTGEVGHDLLQTGHRLPIDLTSLNGTAAVEKRIVVVSDTSKSLSFRPHWRLPDTHSEMAVPLMAGDRLMGVLDLQSSRPGSLTDENVSVFETLAGQLTSAMINAELFEQVEQALAEAEAFTRGTVREGWSTYLDAIEAKERIGYVYENQELHPLTDPIGETHDPCLLTAAIKVAGEPIGALQFSSDRGWSAEEAAMVNTVAAQVSEQIENLRLLGQAARYRDDAEDAVRRLTTQQWGDYLKVIQAGKIGFVYDQDEVQPIDFDHNGHLSPVNVGINVNNKSIGAFSIDGIETISDQDRELITVISEQLGAHLENMRLYSTAQIELDERRRTEQVLDSQRRTLQAVLDNMPAGVFMVEAPSGKPILSNKRAEDFLGRGISPDALGDDLNQVYQAYRFGTEELYPPQDMPVVAGMFGQASMINDMEVRHPDGTRILLQVNGAPVFDANGVVIASVVVFQDITEPHRIQEMVAKRAAELAMVSQISTTVATISDPDEMLQTVVNLVKQSFELYHAHVYLLNDAGDQLVLTKGAGEVGRQMVVDGRSIALGSEKSLVARAARIRKGVIVNDVLLDPEFLPNPLLPKTRSEMAVPMTAGDRLLGVLDIQSVETGRFNEEDIAIQTTLASQVAVGLQNARQFEETLQSEARFRSTSEQLSKALNVAKMANWEFDTDKGVFIFNDAFYRFLGTTVEAEGGYEMSAPVFAQKYVHPEDGMLVGMATQQAMETTDPNFEIETYARQFRADGTLMNVQIRFRVVKDAQNRTIKLMGANQDVTEQRQVAEQIESQRRTLQAVLDNMPAGVFMVEAPSGKPMLSNKRAEEFLGKGISPHATGDDLNQVYQAYRFGTDDLYAPEQMPVVAGMLGRSLSINDMEVRRPDGSSILLEVNGTPVYNAAGDIIASLVMFQDYTDRHKSQEMIAKRAVELATVAEVSTRVATIQNPDEMLQTVVDLTRQAFGLYHAHIYQYDENANLLELSNGAGEVGRRMVSEGRRIRLDTEQSLVARSARTRQGIIVNDVRDDPDFLPNPLLPNTRSEMAVPMIVGDSLLGVIDIQSDEKGRFSPEDVNIMTTLAAQVAVSLQNARSYARAQRQAEREALINAISERIQSTNSIESALQVAVREIGRALGAQHTAIRLGLERKADE